MGAIRVANDQVKSEEKAVSAARISLLIAQAGAVIPNLDYNKGKDETAYSYLDVNGNGLPDRILSNKQVQLNLGFSFTDPIDWNLNTIQKGKSKSISPNKSLSFDKDASSWSLGIGLGSTKAEVDFMMLDINGDGLADKVRISGSAIYVSLK